MKKSIDILQREEIDGLALFRLTDAMLEKFGMAAGARINLLAAITLLRGKFATFPCFRPFARKVPLILNRS